MAEANNKIYAVMRRYSAENDECMGYFTTEKEAQDYLDIIEAEQPLYWSNYYIAECKSLDGTVDKSQYAIAYYYDVMVYNSFAEKGGFVIRTRDDTMASNEGAVKERVESIKFFEAEVRYRIVLGESNEDRAIKIAKQITSELLSIGGGEIHQDDIDSFFDGKVGNGCNYYVETTRGSHARKVKGNNNDITRII